MNETVVQNEQLRRYVETHHIDMIPAGARHGKPWQQAAFWAGANINVFNVVLGGVVVSIGLTFWWAIIAIAAGTLAGALFIALHATQGPRLGVPQTIQSRGQFGFYGAAFLFPCVLLLNVGFIAAQLVIQSQSAQGVIGSLTIPEWILILAVPAVVIGIFGYRWIHRVMQATVVIVGVSMIIMLIQGLRYGSLPAKETTLHAPTAGLFLAGAALLVIDMLSWAPFVSDYTRYLPVNTSGRRLFWAIYAGNVVSTIVACTIGAYLAALLPSLGPVAAIGKISGKWALVILTLSLINSDTLNAYTGAFQVLALGNMWRRFKSVSVMLRVVPFICVMAVGVLIALLGYKHFVNNLSNFLDVLLVIFIPWSAVNLTDYFLVRRGNYDVTAFFIPDGVYGKVAWRGLVAYAVGLAAEWPFVSQPDYVGPFVSHLGGADISWLVGFFVSAVVYLILVVSTAPETGRHDRQMAATSRFYSPWGEAGGGTSAPPGTCFFWRVSTVRPRSPAISERPPAGRGSSKTGRVACPAAHDLGLLLREVDHRCWLGAAVA
jgi:NCS1 family nucleobase:cation symporter-1